jgi:hypothetical protein
MMVSSVRVMLCHSPVTSVPDTFKYRAFFSYSPVDVGVARRVRGRLERFRVDRELVGCPTRLGPVPATLHPIFSDRHDFFAGPSLGSATVAALAESAALVVLASPHSVRSRYVTKQIKFFKLRHPGRPVIVLIVESMLDDPEQANCPSGFRFAVVPEWVDPADALPPDLYESDGFELAIARVTARLIGVDVRDLYPNVDAVRRRQRRICAAITAAMAVAATTGGVLLWQSHHSKLAVAEFVALVERYDLASPTQAAAPGAKESFAEAITAIVEGAVSDERYADALGLLKAGKVVEAERPLKAAAEDKAMQAASVRRSAKAAAAAYRALASIAAISDPGRAREYYVKATRFDPRTSWACFGTAGSNRRPGNSTWRRRPIAG